MECGVFFSSREWVNLFRLLESESDVHHFARLHFALVFVKHSIQSWVISLDSMLFVGFLTVNTTFVIFKVNEPLVEYTKKYVRIFAKFCIGMQKALHEKLSINSSSLGVGPIHHCVSYMFFFHIFWTDASHPFVKRVKEILKRIYLLECACAQFEFIEMLEYIRVLLFSWCDLDLHSILFTGSNR